MKTLNCAQLCILLLCAVDAEASHSLQRLLTHGAVSVGIENKSLGTLCSLTTGEKSQIIDPSGKINLPPGASELNFKFSEPSLLRSLSLINRGGSGTLKVFVSLDGKKWNQAAQSAFKSSDSLIKIERLGVFGSQLRIEFQSKTGAEIISPKIYSTTSDADFVVSQDSAADDEMLDFATGIGGARVIYTTALKPQTLGSDPQIADGLRFDASTNKNHYIVYDLGSTRTVQRIRSISTTGLDSMFVCACDKVNESEDWKGRLSLAIDSLNNLKYEGNSKTKGEDVTLDFTTGMTGRFIIIKLVASASSKLLHFGSFQIAGKGKLVRIKNSDFPLAASQSKQFRPEVVSEIASIGGATTTPSVFAWDVERNVNGILFGASRSSNGLIGAFQSTAFGRSRRADEDLDPDPASIEILRCDFVSEP